MKTKLQQTELFVTCNIYDKASFLFEVYPDQLKAGMSCDEQNKLHEDETTRYEYIDLYHYIQALTGVFDSLLDAYNAYHAD